MKFTIALFAALLVAVNVVDGLRIKKYTSVVLERNDAEWVEETTPAPTDFVGEIVDEATGEKFEVQASDQNRPGEKIEVQASDQNRPDAKIDKMTVQASDQNRPMMAPAPIACPMGAARCISPEVSVSEEYTYRYGSQEKQCTRSTCQDFASEVIQKVKAIVSADETKKQAKKDSKAAMEELTKLADAVEKFPEKIIKEEVMIKEKVLEKPEAKMDPDVPEESSEGGAGSMDGVGQPDPVDATEAEPVPVTTEVTDTTAA